MSVYLDVALVPEAQVVLAFALAFLLVAFAFVVICAIFCPNPEPSHRLNLLIVTLLGRGSDR